MTQTKPETCPDGRAHVWIEVELEVRIGGRTIEHHKCENCERHRAHMSSNPPKPIKQSS